MLDFKFGSLHLYRNGELFFESKSENPSNDPSSPSWKRNSEPREDISVIDSASAILSSGNGKAMSIKSSYLESLGEDPSDPCLQGQLACFKSLFLAEAGFQIAKLDEVPHAVEVHLEHPGCQG